MFAGRTLPMLGMSDPRVMGVLRAAPRVGLFLARSSRRTASARQDDSIVPVRPTPALALQAYLDEVLIAVFRHPDLLPSSDDYAPAAADLAAVQTALLERAGGSIVRPNITRSPQVPDDVRAWHERALGLGYEHVTFTSGWEPYPEEPGRSRWLSHEANRTVHAWVSRAPGAEHQSWLVCAHGFGMGTSASMDLRAFRSNELHRRGINVVVPVLPLHGPRASGRVRGEDLMTIDLVDSMHGMAQATWDLRRVIRWLRESQGATNVGLIGYSLGALVAALVASLEDDLACVIAGIPVVSLPELFRRHSLPHIAALSRRSRSPRADRRRRSPCRLPIGDGLQGPLRSSLHLRGPGRPDVDIWPGPDGCGCTGDDPPSPPIPAATSASSGRARSESSWTSAELSRSAVARDPLNRMGSATWAPPERRIGTERLAAWLIRVAASTSSPSAPGMASARSHTRGTRSGQVMMPKPTRSSSDNTVTLSPAPSVIGPSG